MAAITMLSKTKIRPNKAETPRPATMKSSDANCVVSKGTRIEGDFSSAESIRLDGVVIGQLKCEQRLVIGEAGRVEGNVKASETVVMGHIKGDVVVSGTLHLKGTAQIEGNIQAKFLVVEEGATYVGKCLVGAK
ncbi:MAG: polymer-forming cytoskeletal protein [Phaeodactylibacter sp.]|nr:polymer-forming cytoskeletal protein [Phaeodactylibacter sp.]